MRIEIERNGAAGAAALFSARFFALLLGRGKLSVISFQPKKSNPIWLIPLIDLVDRVGQIDPVVLPSPCVEELEPVSAMVK